MYLRVLRLFRASNSLLLHENLRFKKLDEVDDYSPVTESSNRKVKVGDKEDERGAIWSNLLEVSVY